MPASRGGGGGRKRKTENPINAKSFVEYGRNKGGDHHWFRFEKVSVEISHKRGHFDPTSKDKYDNMWVKLGFKKGGRLGQLEWGKPEEGRRDGWGNKIPRTRHFYECFS